MMVERSFGMKKKKKETRPHRSRASIWVQAWLVAFYSSLLWRWSCVFPLLAKSFLEFQLVGARAQPNLYTDRCFRRRWRLSRAYTRCLATFFLSLSLSLSVSLSLSLSTFISHRCNFLFIMYSPVFQASERATSIRVPSRINSFCRAVGLSSFILPPRYLALIVSRSSATFYVGFDHPCGEVTRRSGCTFLSHANLIAFLHPSRTRSPFP